MIVERTHYFAGTSRDEVLAIRRQASAVRVAIGLPAGRIFIGAGDGPDQPDVIWECGFADRAAHQADLDARAASPDFSAVRDKMRAATRRFSRQVFEDDAAPLANGLAHLSLAGLPVAPREIGFSNAGYELKGYLFLPPGEGPFPAMICNHGSGIDKGTFDVCRPGAAALLASWGIASFLPHRRGYGNSTGPGWREEASAEFGTPEYDAQVSARLDRESDDVVAALSVIAEMPEIRQDHIGVMGSSFGGINTLLSAAKAPRFRCAVEFAGAAMNWERTPALRRLMTEAALRLTRPIFFIQAGNDYSTRPTSELAAALAPTGKTVWSRIYPAFGLTPMEGHLFESTGSRLWADDVRVFLERFL
ncbi:MAG: alpha/beta hydrolase family protein [Parvibaculaceae bacterium]